MRKKVSGTESCDFPREIANFQQNFDRQPQISDRY